jgi:hypothetical protein
MMRLNTGCRARSWSVFRRPSACVGSLIAMPSLRDFKEFLKLLGSNGGDYLLIGMG